MRQRLADTWLNYAWWRYEQAAGSRERSVRARAIHRIENAERLRKHISGGGSFIGYLLGKIGVKNTRAAVAIILGIMTAAVIAAAGLIVYISAGGKGAVTPDISVAQTIEGGADSEDEQLLYSDLDRELCKGVKITGNPVRIRPSPGTQDSAIGEAFSTDNKMFQYLGELDDADGVRWFKIQYTADRAGWVSSEFAQKSYVMPDSDADPGFAEIAEKHSVMGAQMALIRGGRVTRLESYGWADLGHRPMDNAAAIRTASLSKIPLAINAFRLKEEGVIDLNRDISEYWGFEVRNPAYLDTPITVYNLFAETSSFVYIDPARYDLAKMTAALKNSDSYDREHEPGKPSSWAFRIFNTSVAGTTMELSMTGSLMVYSEDWMSGDLGVRGSFAPGRAGDASRLASLYSPAHIQTMSSGELALKVGSTTKGESASLWAGGFTSSAGDMAKLVAVLANDGEYDGRRIISAESVETMERQLYTVSDIESGSTFVQTIPMRYQEHLYGQSRLYYQTGNAYGVYSIAAYNPETKNGAVIITTGAQDQRDENGIYKVCADMLEYAFSLVDDI